MDENQLNDLQQQVDDHEDALTKLKGDLANLSNQFFQGNFSSSQDFSKYARFTSRLRIPVNTVLPTTCHIGELCTFLGTAYVCSAPNTWTKIGTQT